MYQVHFVGIVYFNVCKSDNKIALVPNGTRGNGHIPPHYASLFIEESLHDSDSWWRDRKFVRTISVQNPDRSTREVNLLEFRITKPAEITFDCGDETLECVNIDKTLAELKVVAPGFDLDLDKPDIIAKVNVPGGKLEAFRFAVDELATVQWTIWKHSVPITITAKEGADVRRITLKHNDGPPEVVFSHTPDLIQTAMDNMQRSAAGEKAQKAQKAPQAPPHGAAGAMPNTHHFRLYAKLDKQRDENKFTGALPIYRGVSELPSTHPYLTFLRQLEEIPLPGCVPTCCAA